MNQIPSFPTPGYNCSYSVKLITYFPHLFLRLIYRVLIPLEHYPDCPRHPLSLLAQCIDRPLGHSLYYGRLPALDVYSDGVEPHGVHCLLYCEILPLSAYPMFLRHPCDLSRCTMVEHHQDLEHLPGHHLALASIEYHQLCHRLVHFSPGPHRCSCTF